MAATDAMPVPKKNNTGGLRVYFWVFDSAGALVAAATGFDSEVSLDGAAFGDCTNEAQTVGQGAYYLELTQAEVNADNVLVIVKSAEGVPVPITIYPQEAGDIKVSVQTWLDAVPNILASGNVQARVMAYGAGQDPGDLILSDSTQRIAIEDDGMIHADLKEWLGVAPLALQSQRVDAIVAAYAAGQNPADHVLATPANKIGSEADGHVHADLKEWLGVAPLALQSQRVDASVGGMQSAVIDAAAFDTSAITSTAASTAFVNKIRDAIIQDSIPFNGAAIGAIKTRVELALPSAAPAGLNGLATVDASNRLAGIQGTKTTFDALADIDANDVNDALESVINTHSLQQPAPGAPPVTPTLEKAIMYLYLALTRKIETTDAEHRIHNDAGSVVAKQAISDDTTTFTKEKMVAP